MAQNISSGSGNTSANIVNSIFLWLTNDNTSKMLANCGEIITAIFEIVGIIVAIIGVLYAFKLRQKKSDSTFSYLSKIKTQVQYLLNYMERNQYEIIETLSVNQRSPDAQLLPVLNKARDNISEASKEMLEFLKKSDDQIPAGKGWSKCISDLVDLLSVLENISVPGYYYWNRDVEDEIKNTFYDKHVNNMKLIVKMIIIQQDSMEDQLFGRVAQDDKPSFP